MMKIKKITKLAVALFAAVASLSASADTILFDENFDGDYTKNFTFWYDGDAETPNRDISSLFYSSSYDAYMPWWVAKDSNTTTDRFMISHSYYREPAQSNDWLISREIHIPSTGFVLTFDAQSLPIRDYDKISSLWLYVTEGLIDIRNLPEDPAMVWEDISWGEDVNNCEGDWVSHSFSLDAYAGMTVHFNFVNQNYDKDILCLDNVKIQRRDIAEIVMDPVEEYTAKESYPVGLSVKAITDEGIHGATVKLYSGETVVDQWEIADLANGESVYFTSEAPLEKEVENQLRFVFESPAQEWPQELSASIIRMAFEPVHRVFLEESTSLHCGNCPIAAYTFEQLLEDEELGDRFIPVSVHIAGMGYDPMAVSSYYLRLPEYNSAPLVFVERETTYDGFTPANDFLYDPENEASFAYRIAQRIKAPTYLDVAVEGSWVIEGQDTVAINCTATVRPALNIRDKNYRVAFILTENNVGLDYNQYWVQTNYFSGKESLIGGNLGGWTDLDEYVINLRYHDVARAISSYNGHSGSLPGNMDVNVDYTYNYKMQIPNTYLVDKSFGIQSDHIHRQFCEITAIVIDMETNLVVNAARFPMSEVANHRVTLDDLFGGIEDVVIDEEGNGPVEYFDLMGRRIAEPANGLYIRRQGTRVTKHLR